MTLRLRLGPVGAGARSRLPAAVREAVDRYAFRCLDRPLDLGGVLLAPSRFGRPELTVLSHVDRQPAELRRAVGDLGGGPERLPG